LHLSNNFRI